MMEQLIHHYSENKYIQKEHIDHHSVDNEKIDRYFIEKEKIDHHFPENEQIFHNFLEKEEIDHHSIARGPSAVVVPTASRREPDSVGFTELNGFLHIRLIGGKHEHHRCVLESSIPDDGSFPVARIDRIQDIPINAFSELLQHRCRHIGSLAGVIPCDHGECAGDECCTPDELSSGQTGHSYFLGVECTSLTSPFIDKYR